MAYTNVTVPIEVAYMCSANDLHDLMCALVGGGDVVEASTGTSAYGPYEEGDVTYVLDGKGWSLAYDFMVMGDVARVFRYEIDRQPAYDKE